MIMKVPGLSCTCTVGGKRFTVLSQGILDRITALNLSEKLSEKAAGKIRCCCEDVDFPHRSKSPKSSDIWFGHTI